MKKSLLFLTIAGLSVPSIALAGDPINESLAISANGEIEIENQNGFVKITGWDKAEMKVEGELDERATGYEFRSERGRTVFVVKMPKRSKNRWWNNNDEEGSQLEIFVPKASEVTFDGVNTNVEVRNITGGSQIETVNGDIEARNLTSRVRLNTVNGDVDATDLEGKIRLETVNGDLKDKGSTGESVSYTAVNGDLRVETTAPDINVENVNGDIELKLEQVSELNIDTVNGDIEAHFTLEKDGEIDINTVSGDADLYFSNDVSARFEIDSHAGGDIRNKLSSDRVHKAKYGPARSLEMRLGGGDASVEINTVSGDITLKKQ